MGVDAYRLLPWTADARFSNTGAFAELTWTTASAGRVVAGARLDRASAEDQRESTGMGMMPMPNPTFGDERTSTLSSAFARYEHRLAGSPTTLYVGLGRSERFPDYWELFSPDMAGMGSVNAFSAIRPEKTLQLDAGAQYSGENLRAWVSLYAGRIDESILFRYLSSGMMGTTSMANNVDARTHGGEAGASWRFATSWSIESSLAYAWGENRSDGRALPQMPPLEGRVGLAYDDSAWSFGASWRTVARQSRVSIDEGNVVGRDLGPSPGFAVFTLNAGYRITSKAQITAGIDNLLDRSYAEHLNLAGNAAFGYPADPIRINESGRTFWAKLNLRY
jgi:iron complex outermembrane receptor protein